MIRWFRASTIRIRLRKSSPEPRLWLETVNADFDAPVSTEGWELAVLTHAMQKAPRGILGFTGGPMGVTWPPGYHTAMPFTLMQQKSVEAVGKKSDPSISHRSQRVRASFAPTVDNSLAQVLTVVVRLVTLVPHVLCASQSMEGSPQSGTTSVGSSHTGTNQKSQS